LYSYNSTSIVRIQQPSGLDRHDREERTVQIWFLTALAVAGMVAFARNSSLVRRFVPGRDTASEPGPFERFWSRRNGRLLAVTWLVLFALAIGDAGMLWSGQWQPVADAFLLAQPIAAALLVPLTAGLYLYKRAIPQIAGDEADERERSVQGDVYRRAHAIAMGGLAIGVGLLVFNPAIGTGLVAHAGSRSVELIDVLLPAFLLLFMLPSIAYAWMYPHREDGTPDEPRRWRLTGWLSRAAAR
jgi:hypothetical protein